MVILKTARIALCASMLATACALPMAVFAQDASEAEAQYSAVLQQISDVKISTMQREFMLSQQQAKIDQLKARIEASPADNAKVLPIVTAMIEAIAVEIEKDIPFRETERFNRLDKLREDLADPAAAPGELYRKAITLYDIEVNYGNSISAYQGNNPINPGRRYAACLDNKDSAKCNLSDDQIKAMKNGATIEDLEDSLEDGNYVHFGRLGFIYLDLDSDEGYRYNSETKSWDELAASEIISTRRAVRIARGESAPGVVTAPIRINAAN